MLRNSFKLKVDDMGRFRFLNIKSVFFLLISQMSVMVKRVENSEGM